MLRLALCEYCSDRLLNSGINNLDGHLDFNMAILKRLARKLVERSGNETAVSDSDTIWDWVRVAVMDFRQRGRRGETNLPDVATILRSFERSQRKGQFAMICCLNVILYAHVCASLRALSRACHSNTQRSTIGRRSSLLCSVAHCPEWAGARSESHSGREGLLARSLSTRLRSASSAIH